MKKFVNYKSNLAVLSRAGEQDLTNEFIIGGIIVKFSLQFELGRKVLKELLRYEGVAVAATGSPREILKAAYMKISGWVCWHREIIWRICMMVRQRLSLQAG